MMLLRIKSDFWIQAPFKKYIKSGSDMALNLYRISNELYLGLLNY